VRSGERKIDFPIELRVLDLALPKSADWAFHLDLWQNPYAVARVHGLKPWSPRHMAKMKEVITLAANRYDGFLRWALCSYPNPPDSACRNSQKFNAFWMHRRMLWYSNPVRRQASSVRICQTAIDILPPRWLDSA
jgi:hypothetical protein